MKKNIIITISIIIALVVIGLIVMQFSGTKHKVSSVVSNIVSDEAYNNAYSDIQYTGTDLNILVDEVYQKIEIQRNYVQNYKLNSSMSNINDDKIMEALNTLVNESSNMTNRYNPNDSATKIEFNVGNIPTIRSKNYGEGIDDFSYEIHYMSIHGGSGVSVSNNTSLINNLMADDISFRIFFDYKTDMNYELRSRYENDLANNIDVEAAKNSIKRYSPKMKFEQGVEFRMNGLHFNDSLKLPSTINIWNEYSEDLFPCKLMKNTLQSEYNAYHILYSCERLPNVQDYTGDLKILFD